MKQNKKYGTWICDACGWKYGKRVIEISTYHEDTCDYCGRIKAVTESRDWGFPKKDDNEKDKTE